MPLKRPTATIGDKLWEFWYKWTNGNVEEGDLVPLYIRAWTAFGNLDNEEVDDEFLYLNPEHFFEREPDLLLVYGKHRDGPIIERSGIKCPEGRQRDMRGGGRTSRYGSERHRFCTRRVTRATVADASEVKMDGPATLARDRLIAHGISVQRS